MNWNWKKVRKNLESNLGSFLLSYFAVLKGQMVDNLILWLLLDRVLIRLLVRIMVKLLWVFLLINSLGLRVYIFQIHSLSLMFLLVHVLKFLVQHSFQGFVLNLEHFLFSSLYELDVVCVLHLKKLSRPAVVILGDDGPSCTKLYEPFEDCFDLILC